MYSIDWPRLLTRADHGCSGCVNCLPASATRQARASARDRWLSRASSTVWLLGFTSLFTDISSEMVASVLPMYLVLHVGLTPLAFGVVDGLYQGVAALVRLAAGVFADRWQRHKELAVLGYGLSAVCRIVMLGAGTTWTFATVIAVDRIGKGIRTAPRDALISLRSARCSIATAFGVHRALDAVGAMLGPVFAFLLLASLPGAYDVLFVASFAVAVIGVAVLVLFVPAASGERAPAEPPVSFRSMAADARGTRLRALLIAAFLLGLPTISDAFLYLSLQEQLHIGAAAFPLFYVIASLFTSLFSVPCGRAADRFGGIAVLLGGYCLLGAVYVTLLLLPDTTMVTALVPLALLGGYYAATDGVLAAVTASVLPSKHTGSGLALVATAANVSRLLSSVAFGWLWSVAGIRPATMWYAVALAAVIPVAGFLLVRAQRDAITPHD